jgi:two-component system NtrC family sensor kinase
MTWLADLSASSSRERLGWAVWVRWLVIAGFFLLAWVASLSGSLLSLRVCAVAALFASLLNAVNHFAVDRWRFVVPVSVLALLGDVALITYVVVRTGGVQSPFVMMYVVQVLAAAMLVSFTAAALAALSILACLAIILLAQRAGLHPVVSVLVTDSTSYPLLWSLFLFYCLVLLAYVGGHVGKQLRRREFELEAANRELEESLHSLEAAHTEVQVTIEQLRDTEHQLVQSEKMRALGQFVAGVAHELNNPIAVVTANIEYLEEMLPRLRALLDRPPSLGAVVDPDELRRLNWAELPVILGDCREAARRAAGIVDDLRQVVRGDGSGEVSVVDLNDSVQRALSLLRHLAGSRVEIVLQLAELPRMEGFAAQLDQVLLNLLTNAAQAIGERGRIEVVTRVETAATAGIVGPVAVVEVRDNGIGIGAEARSRVFEPFFTTKPEGEGSGLGLSVSYGIVERHGGVITVESEPGVGSSFTVYLPLRPPDRVDRSVPRPVPA